MENLIFTFALMFPLLDPKINSESSFIIHPIIEIYENTAQGRRAETIAEDISLNYY